MISCDVTASTLNEHYANISTDKQYVPPCRKDSVHQPAHPNDEYPFTEYEVFRLLDNLRSTATGLDELPAWFLRLGAPILAKPITSLFNQSIICSTVPAQWKRAYIRPVNKIAVPKVPGRFPTDINHTSVIENDGEDDRANIHLPSTSLSTSGFMLHGSIRLPSDRLYYSCNHLPPAYYNEPSCLESVCHRILP